MVAVFLALFAGLTVHVEQTVENLTLVIVDGSGSIIQELPAPEAGTYVFVLSDGTYSLRAMVDDRIVGSIPGIAVPAVDSVDITLDPEALGAADNTTEVSGARRNQNIQVNLVDNQALNEALGRQGAQVSPVTEFSAARGNFAAELGGIGRDPTGHTSRSTRRPTRRGLRNPQQPHAQRADFLPGGTGTGLAPEPVRFPPRWTPGLGQTLVRPDWGGDPRIRFR